MGEDALILTSPAHRDMFHLGFLSTRYNEGFAQLEVPALGHLSSLP